MEKVFFMYIKKHSKKFHVSHLGAAPGGVIFIIALLKFKANLRYILQDLPINYVY